MGFQDDSASMSQAGLDIVCMSTLYLFSIGFVVVFSALYCKTYRLNQLYRHAARFRHVQIHVKDVLYPLIKLLHHLHNSPHFYVC